MVPPVTDEQVAIQQPEEFKDTSIDLRQWTQEK